MSTIDGVMHPDGEVIFEIPKDCLIDMRYIECIIKPIVTSENIDEWRRFLAPTIEAHTIEAHTIEAHTIEAPTIEAHTIEAPTIEAHTIEAPTTEVAMAAASAWALRSVVGPEVYTFFRKSEGSNITPLRDILGDDDLADDIIAIGLWPK